MADVTFGVHTDEVDGVVALRLSGDLNRSAQEQLEDAYSSAGTGTVVLDFTDINYINSTGIALVVGLLAKARAAGRSVRAFGLTDHYAQIFEITRISDFMAIYDNETAALAAN